MIAAKVAVVLDKAFFDIFIVCICLGIFDAVEQVSVHFKAQRILMVYVVLQVAVLHTGKAQRLHYFSDLGHFFRVT